MKKMTLLFKVMLVVVTTKIFAQQSIPTISADKLKITSPSPSVAEIGKFGMAGSALSDGAFTTSIPLYEYKTKNLNLPISVTYSTNGLKVDKVASRIGMDWMFSCGGSISRMIVGDADEAKSWVNYPSGFPNISGTTLTQFMNNVGNVETQPDIYSYNFSGRNGKFLFIKSQVIKLDENELTIVHSGNSFIITDGNGIKYFFNDTEESASYSSCGGSPNSQINFKPTAWMLSKIEHPLGDVINFEYESVTTTHLAGVNQTFTMTNPETMPTPCSGGLVPVNNPPCPGLSGSQKVSICSTYSKNNSLYISKIYSNFRGFIEFSYAARQDVFGDVFLKGFDVYDGIRNSNHTYTKYNNTPVRKIKFTQEFVSAGVSYNGPYPQFGSDKRLYLMGISECDDDFCENPKTYTFQYNDLDKLPARCVYAQDHFGYFNGVNNQTMLHADAVSDKDFTECLNNHILGRRDPNPLYSKMGVMKKIIYPTGGSDAIEYESHTTYKPNSSGNCTFKRSLKQVAVTDVSNFHILTPQYFYSESFTIPCDQYVEIEISNLTLPLNSTPSYPSGYYQTSACIVTGGEWDVYPPLAPLDCISTIEALSQNQNKDLSAGPNSTSILRYYLPAGMYRIRMLIKRGDARGDVKITYFDSEPELTGNIPVCGLRLKKIITDPNIPNAIPIVRNFKYTPYGSTLSSGIITNDNFSYFTGYKYNSYLCYNGRPEGDGFRVDMCNEGACQYKQYSSTMFYSAYSYTGNHIYYNSVLEETDGESAKPLTEHKFFVSFDVNAIPVVGNLLTGMPLSGYGSLNGFEYETNYYLSSGINYTLKKKIFKERTFDSRLQNDKEFYFFGRENVNNSCNGISAALSSPYSLYDYAQNKYCVAKYTLLGRWEYVNKITTTEYDDDGNTLVNEQTFEYDNLIHKQPTKINTKDSRGNIAKIDVKTALDKTYINSVYNLSTEASTSIDNMVAKNIVTTPILIETSKINGLTNTVSPINKTLANFKTLSNGIIVPADISYSNSNLPLEKRVQFNQYDDYGNLLEQQKVNDLSEIYLYGYNHQYPVAKIVGSSLSVVQSTITQSILDNPTDDAALRTELTKLRGIAGALVTTYTYKPLVGVTSETDPQGKTIYYEYDNFNRLKLIRDKDNNILKTFDYQYQLQVN